MDDKLNGLLAKFKQLEDELLAEIHTKEEKLSYAVRKGKVHFKEGVAERHQALAKKLTDYLREAKLSSFLTTPAILSCIIPVALLDFWASAYQFVCFPAYGIPKVLRREYIILDRNKLRYLNSIERLNCAYCAYVNGVIAYVQEIAGRTEQHWCPIKHALRLKTMHSRYAHFMDYGDAEEYRARIEKVRRDFEDLQER
ncbi:MAG TPA: hypothetical protein VGO67_22930 [Verrucomicrobiae bacterium]|jgi:hypothetical protein